MRTSSKRKQQIKAELKELEEDFYDPSHRDRSREENQENFDQFVKLVEELITL